MNQERRKTLSELEERMNALRDKVETMKDEVEGELEDLKMELESVQDEEQSAYDNMPENFQNGEQGENAQTYIDAMDEAKTSLEAIPDQFQEVVGSLEDAIAKIQECE